MDCSQARERMWHCLDQKKVELRLQQHFASCTHCERIWQEMKQFEEVLHTLRLDRPSEGFVNSVMDAVKQEKVDRRHTGKNKWATWNHLWIASAATFVLLMMGGGSDVGSSELSSITIYAIRVGWKVTEIVGHIPHLF